MYETVYFSSMLNLLFAVARGSYTIATFTPATGREYTASLISIVIRSTMSVTAAANTPQISACESTRPEVLAPAGDAECLRAAIENGADAVYFGLKDHNARARATNFELD